MEQRLLLGIWMLLAGRTLFGSASVWAAPLARESAITRTGGYVTRPNFLDSDGFAEKA